MIESSWNSASRLDSPLPVKLRAVAIALSNWSRQVFSHNRQKALELEHELTFLSNQSPTSLNLSQQQRIKTELHQAWQREEQYWAMRSRINWLQWGDRNTKFFHATTLQRRQRNQITILRDENQQWVRDPDQIKQMISAYYYQLYSTSGPRHYAQILEQCPQLVDADMNANLLAQPTLEEVRVATFQLGASKAPGTDGLNGLFYRAHWEIIKVDVHRAVQQFFQHGLLPPSLNSTAITLIPKSHNPESLDQYRPISLCNFGYKIFAKVLANRLKPLLPKLITEEQSAFVAGRQIQDNVLVVQEIIHQLRTRKRKRHFQAILKVDMQKAYDCVEWDFLRDYLLRLGFHFHWVHLIMQCVSTPSFSIKMNGELLPSFHPTRGLRQGDPLSPYLFIIIANLLSLQLRNAVLMGSIKGIQLNPRCPTLSHLFFADDAVFFLNGTLLECQNLSNILNQYCLASGQKINRNKSGIFFSSSCPIALQENLAAELRVPVLHRCGKYLGIPTEWGRSKKDMFSWLLTRVQSKLEGWKEQMISKGGKEVLLKAVIQSIPQYAMSVFKIPISLCKVIEKRMAKFWWNNDTSRSGVHWRSWGNLQNRKNQGGLGFRNLVTFNHAMLGKQAWRLLTQPLSLWSKLFKGLYFPLSTFSQANKGSRPSWGWQSLLCGRDSIEKHVSWSVGNGQNINIRQDRWLPMGILSGPKAPEEPTLVADLIDPATSSWRVELLSRFFDMPTIQQITSIQLRPNYTTDALIWTATKHGTFTVKSAYHAIMQSQAHTSESTASSSYQTPTWLWRSIWQMPAAPKIRAFLWSICNNALATRENFAHGLRQFGRILAFVFRLIPLTPIVWFHGSPLRSKQSLDYLGWPFSLISCGRSGGLGMPSSSADLLLIQIR